MTADAGKPPLSDPMAEAMAEDAANAAAKAAREAAEAAPAPKAADDAGPAPEAAPGGSDGAGDAGEAKPADTPPKKDPNKVLHGRIGALTAERKAALERAEAAEARAKAMEELLAAQGRAPAAKDGDTPPSPDRVPPAPTGLTEADVEKRAAEIAYWKDFNAKADQINAAGQKQFSDWGDALGNLNAAGIMSPALVEAAQEAGAPEAILHYLGSDLEEASRVAGLPPIRMGVELAKLAGKLTAPKGRPVSRAPDPIGDSTVRGGADPEIDLARLAETGDMKAWVAAQKKLGNRWAGA